MGAHLLQLRKRALIPLVILTVFTLQGVYAEERILNDKDLLQYAGHLYKTGEYYRAISEYKRFLYFFPDSELREQAVLQIGRSYMAGRQFSEAITYWKLRLEEGQQDAETLNTARILLGISLLDKDPLAVFSLRRDNIKEAIERLSSVKEMDRDTAFVADFVADWRSMPPMERKSPWVAGSLSAVVPGSGSFYTGRYREGVYAFFITALFYWATMDALRNDTNELGYLFGFFTITFYGGNIYTAVNSAHKTNDKREQERLLRIRQKHGVFFIPQTYENRGREY